MELSPVIEPLDRALHDRAAFACGSAPLDQYLKRQAAQDVANAVAAVFVLCRLGSNAILGYYTLSANVIQAASLAPNVRKRLPRYPALPAVLLGRLAVDERERGQGWGKVLLIDALRRSFAFHTQIGAMAVYVDAKDESARAFYEHFGFARFLDHEFKLYLPMQVIEQLLAT